MKIFGKDCGCSKRKQAIKDWWQKRREAAEQQAEQQEQG